VILRVSVPYRLKKKIKKKNHKNLKKKKKTQPLEKSNTYQKKKGKIYISPPNYHPFSG
jgi:hypothetical protein